MNNKARIMPILLASHVCHTDYLAISRDAVIFQTNMNQTHCFPAEYPYFRGLLQHSSDPQFHFKVHQFESPLNWHKQVRWVGSPERKGMRDGGALEQRSLKKSHHLAQGRFPLSSCLLPASGLTLMNNGRWMIILVSAWSGNSWQRV